MWGGDSSGVWDGHVHTAVFKMDNQQRPTVQYKKLCSMFCGSLDGRADWGKMDTCICTAESLHCSPEIVTTLIINYTPNKKFERERKKRVSLKELLTPLHNPRDSRLDRSCLHSFLQRMPGMGSATSQLRHSPA